ncbi:MAG: hypothetical protein ABIJ96_09565 [Elusimicrobiota bacterium]
MNGGLIERRLYVAADSVGLALVTLALMVFSFLHIPYAEYYALSLCFMQWIWLAVFGYRSLRTYHDDDAAARHHHFVLSRLSALFLLPLLAWYSFLSIMIVRDVGGAQFIEIGSPLLLTMTSVEGQPESLTRFYRSAGLILPVLSIGGYYLSRKARGLRHAWPGIVLAVMVFPAFKFGSAFGKMLECACLPPDEPFPVFSALVLSSLLALLPLKRAISWMDRKVRA